MSDVSDKPLTPTEWRDILEAKTRAERSADRAKLLHGVELRLVELIGTDGDGGDFAALKKKVDAMETDLKAVVLFTHKAKWTIALFASGAGAIAAVAMVLVEKFLGK